MPRVVLSGVVVADKCDKTIRVLVERTIRHPRYKKVVRSSKHYMVHDEHNRYKVGDVVRLVSSRPISARKCWVVLYD